MAHTGKIAPIDNDVHARTRRCAWPTLGQNRSTILLSATRSDERPDLRGACLTRSPVATACPAAGMTGP